MSPSSKELEIPTLQELEEVAATEVDSYIEQIEKRPEVDPSIAANVQVSPTQTPTPTAIKDHQGQVVMAPVDDTKKVVLPLTEDELKAGLHHQILDSVRWLSEWCVMLIKKYPGKVFYKSNSQST
jgi:hypothetical protein